MVAGISSCCIVIRNMENCASDFKVRKMKNRGEGKICVVVGAITDDLRIHEIPALKVCLVFIK